MTKVSRTNRNVNGLVFFGLAPFSRVDAAFKRGPIGVQRDHRKRAHKANYIGRTLKGDQCVFHIVIWQGQERLIDGYTRVERIHQDLTDRPKSVGLVVHAEVHTMDELKSLYDQFNSSAALKKTADRFDEGLRLVDLLDNLVSQLVLRGPKSSAYYAVGAKGVRAGVEQCADGIRFVDQLSLQRNGETVGMLAAYYAIGQFGGFMKEEAQDFIRKMNQAHFEPTAGTVKNRAILDARKFHEAKRAAKSTSCDVNVFAIRDKTLSAFVEAVEMTHLVVGGMRRLTLGEFIEVMKGARERYGS